LNHCTPARIRTSAVAVSFLLHHRFKLILRKLYGPGVLLNTNNQEEEEEEEEEEKEE